MVIGIVSAWGFLWGVGGLDGHWHCFPPGTPSYDPDLLVFPQLDSAPKSWWSWFLR